MGPDIGRIDNIPRLPALYFHRILFSALCVLCHSSVVQFKIINQLRLPFGNPSNAEMPNIHSVDGPGQTPSALIQMRVREVVDMQYATAEGVRYKYPLNNRKEPGFSFSCWLATMGVFSVVCVVVVVADTSWTVG